MPRASIQQHNPGGQGWWPTFKVEQLLLSPGRSCPMCGTCVQHSTLQETVTSQLSAQTRLLDALEKKVLEMRTALEELALGMEPECVLKGIVQPNWKLSSFTHVIPNFIFYCWTQIFWWMLIIKYLVPLWLPLYFLSIQWKSMGTKTGLLPVFFKIYSRVQKKKDKLYKFGTMLVSKFSVLSLKYVRSGGQTVWESVCAFSDSTETEITACSNLCGQWKEGQQPEWLINGCINS